MATITKIYSWTPGAIMRASEFNAEFQQIIDTINGGISSVNLAALSVTEDKLANDAVTTAKIRNGQVTSVKIAPLTITADALATDSVTSAKVAPGLDPVKIGNGTVTIHSFGRLAGVTAPIQHQLNERIHRNGGTMYGPLQWRPLDGVHPFPVMDLNHGFQIRTEAKNYLGGVGTRIWHTTPANADIVLGPVTFIQADWANAVHVHAKQMRVGNAQVRTTEHVVGGLFSNDSSIARTPQGWQVYRHQLSSTAFAARIVPPDGISNWSVTATPFDNVPLFATITSTTNGFVVECYRHDGVQREAKFFWQAVRYSG